MKIVKILIFFACAGTLYAPEAPEYIFVDYSHVGRTQENMQSSFNASMTAEVKERLRAQEAQKKKERNKKKNLLYNQRNKALTDDEIRDIARDETLTDDEIKKARSEARINHRELKYLNTGELIRRYAARWEDRMKMQLEARKKRLETQPEAAPAQNRMALDYLLN